MTEFIGGAHQSETHQKALRINLDPRWYGTIAEIGVGQEVVRWFFRVGGAAGTVAKSISAYDMAVSDAVYGKAERYVSMGRLQGMLDKEFQLNVERLDDERGDSNCFFAFADTVVARSYQGGNECHGWMGVKFQAQAHDEPSQIVMHVRMLDVEAWLQQEALGIVGVNLLYGAFFEHHEPEKLIESLLDGLTVGRIDIDMIQFRGIEFRGVDNRLMALKLGLSGVAMFGPDRAVLQPSEVLRKKAILVERGSFRPPTHVNIDMLETARAKFEQEPAVAGKPVLQLTEITMRNLLAGGQEVDRRDFLARAELLAACGQTVLITDYFGAGRGDRAHQAPRVLRLRQAWPGITRRCLRSASTFRMAATLTDSVIDPARTFSTARPKGSQLRTIRSSGSCASAPASRPVARNMWAVSVVTPLLLSTKPSSRQRLADSPVSSRSSRLAAASTS